MRQYDFGKSSRGNLDTCKDRLQLVIEKSLALGLIDFSVVGGVRSKAEQTRYFVLKRSRVEWPNGKHNVLNEGDKCEAADVVPFVNGKSSYDVRHCCYLAGIIIAVGASIGVKIRWGGNWDMDGEPITDQDFQDLVHFEMV